MAPLHRASAIVLVLAGVACLGFTSTRPSHPNPHELVHMTRRLLQQAAPQPPAPAADGTAPPVAPGYPAMMGPGLQLPQPQQPGGMGPPPQQGQQPGGWGPAAGNGPLFRRFQQPGGMMPAGDGPAAAGGQQPGQAMMMRPWLRGPPGGAGQPGWPPVNANQTQAAGAMMGPGQQPGQQPGQYGQAPGPMTYPWRGPPGGAGQPGWPLNPNQTVAAAALVPNPYAPGPIGARAFNASAVGPAPRFGPPNGGLQPGMKGYQGPLPTGQPVTAADYYLNNPYAGGPPNATAFNQTKMAGRRPRNWPQQWPRRRRGDAPVGYVQGPLANGTAVLPASGVPLAPMQGMGPMMQGVPPRWQRPGWQQPGGAYQLPPAGQQQYPQGPPPQQLVGGAQGGQPQRPALPGLMPMQPANGTALLPRPLPTAVMNRTGAGPMTPGGTRPWVNGGPAVGPSGVPMMPRPTFGVGGAGGAVVAPVAP